MVDKLIGRIRTEWVTLAFSAIGIFYAVVIQNNNMKNDIMKEKENRIKIEAQVLALQDKKLDKETFTLILTVLTDLKADVRGLQESLNNQRK